MEARGHLDRLQVIGAVIRAQRAFLEWMLNPEQLFRMLAQLIGHECAEITVRVVRNHSGRHAHEGESGHENTSYDQRWTHGAFLLSRGRKEEVSGSQSSLMEMTPLQRGGQISDRDCRDRRIEDL